MTGDPASLVRVLLVEDDAALRLVARLALTRSGFSVTVAETGADALAAATAAQPDVIVLDWMMPGIDGLETCTRLKAHPATRKIPVVFLTAHTRASEIARGLAAGACGHISKPVNPMTLGPMVRGLLEQARHATGHDRAQV